MAGVREGEQGVRGQGTEKKRERERGLFLLFPFSNLAIISPSPLSLISSPPCLLFQLVEVAASEDDLVWIHDYHLLALPSLLRRRAHRARIGLFLHSPFPSSEIFRTFPRREEVLRALLNADLVGFHTFDYARHFLSACARMLGLEHVAARGAIQLEYCGRAVGIKIMPTGVKPERWLASCAWPATLARRSELGAALAGRTVLLGVDDLDAFKGIDLKALALERLLDQHPALRGRVTLIQASGPPRGAAGREEEELTAFIGSVVARVNAKYGDPAGRGDPTGAAGLACGPDGGPAPYTPIIWLRRALPMAERVALYAAADVVVVMAVRDGMNLVPYEYVACRQGAAVVDGAAGGAPGAEGGDTAAGAAAALAAAAAAASTTAAPSVRAGMASLGSAGGSAAGLGSGVGGGSGGGGGSPRSPGGGASNPPGAHSTLVVSEFVGCSPSLSGAIRCNPWSVCAVADALHTALSLPPAERALRHANHWRYVSTHTTRFWAASFVSDLRRLTAGHGALRCYALGLGLDSFRLVALTPAFRRLDPAVLAEAYARSERRLFLLDYDGTLNSPSTSASVSAAPSEAVLATLGALVSDPKNSVYVVSGRARGELGPWFAGLGPGLGIAAEHGYYFKPPGSPAWTARGDPGEDGWRAVVLPILQLYSESTDGAWVEAKESALVWHYGAADPDFGAWQAKELLDHLEGVLSTEPAEAVAGSGIVEVKPRGVSKGKVAERVLEDAASRGAPPSFVLCVGDDRSDEDMFAAMEGVAFSPHALAEVFACTVGQKPSRAPFYVNDTADVGAALALLVDTPPKAPSSAGATSPRLVAAAAAAGAAVAAAGSRGAGGSPRVGAA